MILRTLTLATVTLALLVLPSGAQEAKEKSKAEEKKKELFVREPPDENDKYEKQLGMLLEYFVLDHRTANKFVREYSPRAHDVEELRDELEAMIDRGEAELLDTQWVVARSGQRAKTESIKEVIYPTEWDPPEIPNNLGVTPPVEAKNPQQQPEANRQATLASSGSVPNPPMTHATPTAFETRNVGLTFEVDPVIGADERAIDLNLAPEIVTHIGNEHFTRDDRLETAYGVDHLQMPTFYTIKTTTQVTTLPGKYHLIGIHTPYNDPEHRILVLLRADLITVK